MKHFIIPVFIPHFGCIHSCVFCNQQKITGRNTPVNSQEVADIIDEHLDRITEKRHIEVAFYGGSFTALTIETQSELLKPAYLALKAKKIHGIRLSTRPDCITNEIVQNLIQHGVSTIELGVQSLDNRVLEASARGHSCSDVFQAVTIIKKMGLFCGLQLMPGLPQEDWKSLIRTAQGIIKLAPDFIRIYPTLVIAHTHLADMYHEGSYKALSLATGITYGAFLKLLFDQYKIPVIRTGLQATEELDKSSVVLAGPYHPAFGEMVDSYIFYVMLAHFAELVLLLKESTDEIIIHHHPRDTSKIRGMSNSNMKKFKSTYNTKKIILKQDGLHMNEVIVEYQDIYYVINKKMLFYI